MEKFLWFRHNVIVGETDVRTAASAYLQCKDATDMIVLSDGKRVRVSRSAADEFLDTRVLPKTEDADALLAGSATRRKHGDYYTPQTWALEARLILQRICLDPYIWDASCGTGNLTAGAGYESILQTTLFADDIRAFNARSPPTGPDDLRAVSDFLNDPEPDRIQSFFSAPTKSCFVFFNNPPFKTAAVLDSGERKRHAGVGKTRVHGEMTKMGFRADGLHTQFMFRVDQLADKYSRSRAEIYNAVFLPTNALTSSQNSKFWDYYRSRWSLVGGFVVPASDFTGTSAGWSVSFTVWRWGGRTEPGNTLEAYTSERERAGTVSIDPVRADQLLNNYHSGKGGKPVPALPLSNAMTVFVSDKTFVAPCDSIGYLVSSTNSVKQNNEQVYVLSSLRGNGHGKHIIRTKESLLSAATVFTARRLIASTWLTWHLDYTMPTPKAGFDDWAMAALVYMIFDAKCLACSFRYEKFDIRNHLFFMLRADVMDMSQTVFWQHNDTEESFAATVLHDGVLIPQARAVLDQAKKTWSARMREGVHAGRWDAGLYQMKCASPEFAELSRLHKILGATLRPGVFIHGFLRE